jgi:hypothetical protein
MTSEAFIRELEVFRDERLAPILEAGRASLAETAGDPTKLLQIALGNEINVSEIAATWMPSTSEVDVKLAFAKQAGDEAGHFELVSDRLTALGFDVASFKPSSAYPLYDYLRGLSTTVERVAAGLFTLEALAYGVNENFIALCDARGDHDTAAIYRKYIQPDEKRHGELGRELLLRYATDEASRTAARETVGKLLEIAGASRSRAAQMIGTACFPGC